MKRLISLFTLALVYTSVAQDLPYEGEKTVLTLDQCIEIALDNNISMKQSVNNLALAKSNRSQGYFNFLPNLNAQVDYSIYDGNNVDPVTGRQEPITKTSNPYIASNLTIFSGLQNYNFLNQRIQEYKAAKNAVDANQLRIESGVIASYLIVIVDRENFKISQQRLELLENQYEREVRRESIGVGNMETVLNFKAQAATERLNLVNLTNQYRRDLLSLLQLLQISDVLGYTIADFEYNETDLAVEIDPYQEVADDILAYSFDIKQAEANRKAAQYQLKQAKGNFSPSLTASGYFASAYTSNDSENDLGSQLEAYQAKGTGVTLSIPIFNRMQVKNGVDRAKVNYLNAELDSRQRHLDVTNAIQSNYLDLIAAQTSYTTATETFDASNQTFDFVQKRFDQGNTDFYTYLESLNNKNRAEGQLVSAKYSMILRNRILNLYRGPN